MGESTGLGALRLSLHHKPQAPLGRETPGLCFSPGRQSFCWQDSERSHQGSAHHRQRVIQPRYPVSLNGRVNKTALSATTLQEGLKDLRKGENVSAEQRGPGHPSKMPQRRAGGPLQRLKLEGAVPFPREPQAREAARFPKTLSHRECPPQPGQFRAVGVVAGTAANSSYVVSFAEHRKKQGRPLACAPCSPRKRQGPATRSPLPLELGMLTTCLTGPTALCVCGGEQA